MELKNRKVLQFRTHIDPAIPPVPKNSFSKKELHNWEFEITPIGIYVKAFSKSPGALATDFSEHIVPYANVQSIKLAPLEDAKKPSES